MQEFEQDDFVCKIALLNYLALIVPDFGKADQLAFLASLGRDDDFTKIVCASQGVDTLLTRPQLLAVALENLAQPPRAGGRRLSEAPGKFRRCLLRVLDALGATSNHLSESGTSQQAIKGYVFRSAHFAGNESPESLLGRYYSLYIHHYPTAAKRRPGEAVHLERELLSEAGIDLRALMLCGVLLWGHYFKARIDERSRTAALNDLSHFCYWPDTSHVRVEYVESVQKAMNVLSANRFSLYTELARGRLGADEQSRVFDLQVIRRRPLYQVPAGGLVPLDVAFVMERVTSGVKWYLHDLYRDRAAEVESEDCRRDLLRRRQQILSFHGRAVESYVEDLLETLYGRRQKTVLLTESDCPKGADFVLYEYDSPDSVLLLEVTTSSVRYTTSVSADIAAISSEFEHILLRPRKAAPYGKLGQLDYSIAAFERGEMPRLNHHRSRIRTVLPVLVTESEWPTAGAFMLEYRKIAHTNGLLGKWVDNFLVASIEELEVVAGLVASRKMTMSGAFKRCLGSPWRNWSVGAYLKDQKLWQTSSRMAHLGRGLLQDGFRMLT